MEGYDGGFAERVDLAQGGGGFEGLAVVELDVVGEVKFLEEPEDALGARLVKPAPFFCQCLVSRGVSWM